MEKLWHIVRLILGLAVMGAAAGWVLVRWWRKSEDRPSLLVKWAVTLLDLLFLLFVAAPLVAEGGYAGAFGGIPMVAVAGLVLAVIWTEDIAGWVGRKFGQLYDGGDLVADPEPFFSIAEARRKQGKPADAVAEVVKQLERFPTSFRGLMLLADIQARDLHDLDAARLIIGRFINQPGHTPKNVAYALTQLADWELALAKDPDAARVAFEEIIARFPESPEAHQAHQRIARLASPEFLQTERPPIALLRSEERLGLRPDFTGLKTPPPNPNVRIAALVSQLERYPQDNQTREELALAYANDLDRVDLAAGQLEQLIAQPHAPAPHIARWLNLLADLQLRERGNPETIRRTIQRIVDWFPDTALAEAAQRRLATLERELRSKNESQAVPLGSPADLRLGLKMKR
jgi:tetratricopeptide (TPR) repeat protein